MAISPAIRQQVRQRAGGLCEYCHANEQWQFIRFTIDHVQPSSAGGGDDFENLALACRNCNERRGNQCEAIDPETGRVHSLFHPRQKKWQEHFAWSADKIRLVGLTGIGRATIGLLDSNDERHEGIVLRIRQRDLQDGFHPPVEDSVLET